MAALVDAQDVFDLRSDCDSQLSLPGISENHKPHSNNLDHTLDHKPLNPVEPAECERQVYFLLLRCVNSPHPGHYTAQSKGGPFSRGTWQLSLALFLSISLSLSLSRCLSLSLSASISMFLPKCRCAGSSSAKTKGSFRCLSPNFSPAENIPRGFRNKILVVCGPAHADYTDMPAPCPE